MCLITSFWSQPKWQGGLVIVVVGACLGVTYLMLIALDVRL